jgi:hypothetical protein
MNHVIIVPLYYICSEMENVLESYGGTIRYGSVFQVIFGLLPEFYLASDEILVRSDIRFSPYQFQVSHG